jgi:signal transduction histidine kinase
VEMAGEDDHVHLVEYPLRVPASSLVNSFEGVSRRLLRQDRVSSSRGALGHAPYATRSRRCVEPCDAVRPRSQPPRVQRAGRPPTLGLVAEGPTTCSDSPWDALVRANTGFRSVRNGPEGRSRTRSRPAPGAVFKSAARMGRPGRRALQYALTVDVGAPRDATATASRPTRAWAGYPDAPLLALLVAGAMIAFYQIGARLGFQVGGFAWPFWPANGLVFAVLVRRPGREWALYSVAQVIGELAGGALVGLPFNSATLAYGLIDAAESLLAASLLRRVAGHQFDLRSLRRVSLFLGACFVAVLVAAGAAGLVALLRGSQHGLRFFATFAVGDLLGFAVVAPAVLRVLEVRAPSRRLSGVRKVEAMGLALLLVGVTLGGFLLPWPAGSYALVHAVIPVLAWCSLRLGTAGASFGILLVAAIGTVLTPRGLGPFAILAPATSPAFASMQLFLAFVSTTALLFAAAVAERRAAAAAVAQTARVEATGTLAGAVAHDFANFLVIILGGADAAASTLPSDHAAQEYFLEIRQAARSATKLTRRLLALSRGGEGREELLDVGAIMRDAERMARHLVGPEVRFEVRAATEPLPVLADRVDLERVIFNLVSNARGASRPGGSVIVEVCACDLGSPGGSAKPGVLLSVRDDGTGMDPQTLERIFEPFFTTKKEGTGTGLGLAATRAIVERAHGTIRVASTLGEGTLVSVRLPRVERLSSGL